LRAHAQILAPFFAKISNIALPIPLFQPVIAAVLPFKSSYFLLNVIYSIYDIYSDTLKNIYLYI